MQIMQPQASSAPAAFYIAFYIASYIAFYISYYTIPFITLDNFLGVSVIAVPLLKLHFLIFDADPGITWYGVCYKGISSDN